MHEGVLGGHEVVGVGLKASIEARELPGAGHEVLEALLLVALAADGVLLLRDLRKVGQRVSVGRRYRNNFFPENMQVQRISHEANNHQLRFHGTHVNADALHAVGLGAIPAGATIAAEGVTESQPFGADRAKKISPCHLFDLPGSEVGHLAVGVKLGASGREELGGGEPGRVPRPGQHGISIALLSHGARGGMGSVSGPKLDSTDNAQWRS